MSGWAWSNQVAEIRDRHRAWRRDRKLVVAVNANQAARDRETLLGIVDRQQSVIDNLREELLEREAGRCRT